MPGIRVTGGDFRIPAGAIRISIGEDGDPEVGPDPVVPEIRTDMWSYWLMESVEAAITARKHAIQLAEVVAADPADEKINDLLVLELRASMRAMSSAAFAVDSFYAAVKARSPEHPDQQKWREKTRPSRVVQVFETFRYHLKLKDPGASEIRERIQQLFKFRGWAVHAASEFRVPIHREDIDAGVDWHFVAFSAENAAKGVGMAVQMLDVLVEILSRGSEELAEMQRGAREAMDRVFAIYDSAPTDYLSPIERAEGRVPEDHVPHAEDVSQVEGAPDTLSEGDSGPGDD